ncbi:uncharacterized protein LOC129217310 [Uloborus diversus]|uniref:uncharacterized protein LOC129217310 n=1 Tax=Uloborus diversus TaxID=327109 RepID=UPI00240982A8|nr:uncharacterized protein LOC129217310 [Uloborus diversus]
MRMGASSNIVVFIVLSLTIGALAKEDFRNQTIECIFRAYDACYHGIASLGANFSAHYDDSPVLINSTCKLSNSTIECLGKIPTSCYGASTPFGLKNASVLIQQLCTNNSQEQIKFLNSSHCYNKQIMRRRNCVKKYSSEGKTDAKSLCCSNLKTQKCLREEMNVCPTNTTEFQNTVMSTYRSYHNYICQDTEKHCGHSVKHFVSAFVLFLAFLFTFSLH